MIFEDENDPKAKKPRLRPLDTMSVQELEDYITLLKAEIARVEADIARKNKTKAAADALFRG